MKLVILEGEDVVNKRDKLKELLPKVTLVNGHNELDMRNIDSREHTCIVIGASRPSREYREDVFLHKDISLDNLKEFIDDL